VSAEGTETLDRSPGNDATPRFCRRGLRANRRDQETELERGGRAAQGRVIMLRLSALVIITAVAAVTGCANSASTTAAPAPTTAHQRYISSMTHYCRQDPVQLKDSQLCGLRKGARSSWVLIAKTSRRPGAPAGVARSTARRRRSFRACARGPSRVRERPCGSGLAAFAAAAVRFVTAHVAAGAELAGGRRDLERDGGLGTCSSGRRQLVCSSRACVSIALVMAIGALRLVLVDRCARSGVDPVHASGPGDRQPLRAG
jgi:hypothetical protein